MKRMLVVMTTLLFAVTASAQVISTVGFKAGLVRANQDFHYTHPDISDMEEPVNNLLLGVALTKDLSHSLRLAVEFQYKTLGHSSEILVTTEEGPEGVGKVKNVHSLQYWSVPVTLGLKLGGKWYLPRLFAGAAFNRYASYDFKSEVPAAVKNLLGDDFEKSLAAQWEDMLFSHFEKSVFSWLAGICFEYPWSERVCFVVDARYSRDLKSSFDNGFLDISNNMLEVTGGVNIAL